jgi:hypothetical protein
LCGHPRLRSGQDWNDWTIIEWPALVVGKDGESHIVHLDVEGQIYRFIDLQYPQSFDFDMFHNRLIPNLQDKRHTIYAIIHSLKRAATATFQNLLSERVSFYVVAVIGAENCHLLIPRPSQMLHLEFPILVDMLWTSFSSYSKKHGQTIFIHDPFHPCPLIWTL